MFSTKLTNSDAHHEPANVYCLGVLDHIVTVLPGAVFQLDDLPHELMEPTWANMF